MILTICIALMCRAASAQPVEPAPGQIPPLPPRLPEGLPPAFPGAWGGGMFATGGRGGKVVEVTNLDDSGPGSFRAAVEAEGARIVVFKVAGIIELQSNININHPNITIAGQSAPGDGICIAGQSVNINTENVIMRHVRVRRGKPRGGQGSDNIGGNPIRNIIVDHCSASWGMDENLSLYRYMKPNPGGGPDTKLPVMNLTIQFCITSEALNAGNHAFGGTWGGQDSTFHHNLFACNTGRNPSIGMSGEFDFRNNVMFNWQHRTMDGGDETSIVNVINNFYKPGPATNNDMRATMVRIEQRNMYSPGRRWEQGTWYPKSQGRPGKWYVAGNIVDGFPDVTKDNWSGMRGPDEIARVNTPFEGWPVYQETALRAFDTVLAKAGATLPKRDAVDARVTEMVRSGKPTVGNGIIKDPEEVGGYPKYSFTAGDVAADTDKDGMPDEWEKKHALNASDPADGAIDTDKDGYSNVEEFLNGTNPAEKVDYSNLDNNVDKISG
jgi:pectate lyase